MAKNIEYFRKKIAEMNQEQAKLSGNLDNLKQQRARLEDEIDAAIDADELGKVDALTAKETELDNRIRTAEKILERKREKATFDREELAEASNSEMRKYRDDCLALINTAEKYRRMYFESLIKAGEIVKVANAVRDEYKEIAGTSEHFETINLHFQRFLSPDDRHFIMSISPNGISLICSLNQ